MSRRYPVEFRRKVLDLVEAGRPAGEIADQHCSSVLSSCCRASVGRRSH